MSEYFAVGIRALGGSRVGRVRLKIGRALMAEMLVPPNSSAILPFPPTSLKGRSVTLRATNVVSATVDLMER